MTRITEREAADWLRRYGAAWEDGDVGAISTLFADDARYHETPFDPPMVGRSAIETYWTEGASNAQSDVTFGFEIWAISGEQCISHWHASFRRVPGGEAVKLDGVFRLAFRRLPSDRIVCTSLREWWHRI